MKAVRCRCGVIPAGKVFELIMNLAKRKAFKFRCNSAFESCQFPFDLEFGFRLSLKGPVFMVSIEVRQFCVI